MLFVILAPESAVCFAIYVLKSYILIAYIATQAKLKKARHEVSSLVILLDDIKDTDFHPLLDLLTEANLSEIDAVDIINRSVCILSWEYLLVLVRASSRKLRVVDLQDILFGKDFLLYVLPHLYILFPTLCHNQFMFCVAADATIF